MTIEERIDNIYEKMQTVPLSYVSSMLLPVALECEDYEGYCILTFWGNPLHLDKNISDALRKEMYRVLKKEDLSDTEVDAILRTSVENYIKLRTIDDNKVSVLSVKDMENQIKICNELLEAVEPPSGLHPVDLYYFNESSVKSKLKTIENRKEIEQQYAVLYSYLVTKLTEYRRKGTIEERKKKLEKRIENSKDVFIIHGHNEAKRRELKSLLKDRFDLNPIILSEQPDQGLTIIEKFEKYAVNCSYAFALFTPDDIVTNGDRQYFQARPNVIFELGWFYANLGRSRVCILDQASDRSEIFSDLQGVLRIQFNNNVSEKLIEIERELKSVGII